MPRTPGTRGASSVWIGDDPRVRAGQRHQLHVQRVVEPDIGGILLRAGDALDAAEAGKDDADDAVIAARPVLTVEPCGRERDRLDDAAVAGAAAQVAGEPFLDLVVSRMRDWSTAGSCAATIMPGMQNPHCTAPRFDERLLHRVELSVGAEPFDRHDGLAIALDGEHEARVHRAAVQQHRAGAAFAFGAAFLRAGEIQLIAKHLEQRVMRLRRRASGACR